MPNVQTDTPIARRHGALLAVFLLVSGLVAGVAGEAQARDEEPAQRSMTKIPTRDDGSIELRQLRSRNLSGPQAAAALRQLGSMGPAEAARVLSTAEYTSAQIEEALVHTYNLSPQVARRHVGNAQAKPARLQHATRIPRGVEVTTCVRPDGSLFQCPAGSPVTGATVKVDPPPSTSMSWSGVMLQPDNDAVAGTQLRIRPPTGATLPAVSVQLGGQTLAVISSSPQEVRVQLPDATVSGALTMRNLDNQLSGTLASEYRVRKPGVLDALQAGHGSTATWRNSYLMGLLSYYIYSDALGSGQHAANFRNLMLEWGANGTQFVTEPKMHLRAAVVWGQDWVAVVFRGTEQHNSAFCIMEMVHPGICAHVPTNWSKTNLAYRPLHQRPEWGDNVRTHPGFDEATDLLYEEILEVLNTRLTEGHRLYVTGHSLGAAMATLFSFRAEVLSGIDVHGLYTFGSPRVGNIPFALAYPEPLHNKTQRWQNRADPAPGLPPGQPIQGRHAPPGPNILTYRHVGRLNYIPPQGAVEFNRQNEPFQAPSPARQLDSDHFMALGGAAYLSRMHQVMPTAIRSTLPVPP